MKTSTGVLIAGPTLAIRPFGSALFWPLHTYEIRAWLLHITSGKNRVYPAIVENKLILVPKMRPHLTDACFCHNHFRLRQFSKSLYDKHCEFLFGQNKGESADNLINNRLESLGKSRGQRAARTTGLSIFNWLFILGQGRMFVCSYQLEV